MRCPSCGSSNEDGANFCTQCGKALVGPEATSVFDQHAVRSAATGRDLEEDVDEDDDPTDPGGGADEFAAIRRSGDDLRYCPACNAANSPRRMLCGRCGADLETGERAVSRPREGFTASPAGSGREPRVLVSRTILAIVTAGVLIGGGLGAMVALGVGPFGAERDGPPVAIFDDNDYPGPPGDLDPPAVGASTTHEPVADRMFDPQLMLDDDLGTAWNNSGQDNPMGIGEELRVEFSEPVWLTGIVVANGDQRDDDRYLGNARVQRARVVLDAGVSFTVSLLDQPGRQAVQLDVPELTTGLRIEILEAYPGDTYDDLALAELSFRGYVANEEDAELATERARFPRVVPTGP